MFYIQHGYGKSNKIDEVINRGEVDGVILSPGHEDTATLQSTADALIAAGLDVLVDPQAYIYSTRPKGTLRFHARNGVDLSSMSWAGSATTVLADISKVEDLGVRLGLNARMIAPSPYHASFGDYWMPTALQYARTAGSEWRATEVLATIAISQDALSDWSIVEEWLDAATTLDVSGFYLVVSRSDTTYPPLPWNPLLLANLLRVIHTLSVVNGFQVIWGYADVDGLLGLGAGAKGMAAGWSYSLRQFAISRYYTERGGGAQPIPRLFVRELLSSLRVTEVADILDIAPGEFETLRSLVSQDVAATSNPEAQVSHLVELSRLAASLGDVPLPDRFDAMRLSVQRAISGFSRLAALNISVDARYIARLRSYAEALDIFDREVAR